MNQYLFLDPLVFSLYNSIMTILFGCSLLTYFPCLSLQILSQPIIKLPCSYYCLHCHEIYHSFAQTNVYHAFWWACIHHRYQSYMWDTSASLATDARNISSNCYKCSLVVDKWIYLFWTETVSHNIFHQ